MVEQGNVIHRLEDSSGASKEDIADHATGKCERNGMYDSMVVRNGTYVSMAGTKVTTRTKRLKPVAVVGLKKRRLAR